MDSITISSISLATSHLFDFVLNVLGHQLSGLYSQDNSFTLTVRNGAKGRSKKGGD